VLVSELELPELDYLDADLKGPRYDALVRKLRERIEQAVAEFYAYAGELLSSAGRRRATT
jgi:hypothetical protein